MAAAVLNPFHKQRPIPSPELSTASDTSSKTFQRLRDTIRTATRSKKQPPPPVDELGAVLRKSDKGKEKEKDNGGGMLRRVGLRKQSREQEVPVPVPPLPGFTSPSLRLASLSSPTLHLSSPPSKSHAPISPPRQRTRKTTLEPTSKPLGHRSTKSYNQADLNSPPDTPTPLPRTPSRRTAPINPASPPPRAHSPHHSRPPLTSASTSYLPTSSSTPSPTPRRPSIDQTRRVSDTQHRPSLDSPRRSADPPSSPTPPPPASPVRLRAISPTQKFYAQNRHFNISSGSLILPPSNPEHRELIRTATSLLCKEVIKPPVHLARSDAGLREWGEVEVRTRALARLERIWQRTGSVAASSSTNVSAAGLSSSGLSISGEERERRLFCDALRDGYVLCQLMNKLRSANVVRPDVREDGFVRTSNVTKFLAACASYGLPNEDLFQRDDLIEATSESLARVAKTIIALIRFVDSPAPSRLKYVSGQGKPVTHKSPSTSPVPYSQGSLSRASASTPNLSNTNTSVSPMRKRWNPPADLPPVRSNSPGESTTTTGSSPGGGQGNDEDAEDSSNTAEVKPFPIPPVMKPPPRSPLRSKSSSKHLDAGGLFAWARNAALPQRASISDSTRASVGDPSIRESMSDMGAYGRQSMASNLLSEADTTTYTAVSSILDGGRSSSGGGLGGNGGHGHFGTIRTMTTDLTSEAPSMTRTEGSSIAEEMSRKKSLEGNKFGREREPHSLDLSRVAEETDESVSSKGHHTRKDKKGAPSSSNLANNKSKFSNLDKPLPQPAVNLRKGRWPDDFIDAFSSRSQGPSNPTPAVQELLADIQFDTTSSRNSVTPPPPSISISPPRKLAAVGPSRRLPSNNPSPSNASSEAFPPTFPRRPTHRPRHSIDTPPTSGLLPKEAVLRRDASPDSVSSAGKVMLRRHTSTKPGHNQNHSGSSGSARVAPRSALNLDTPPHSNSDSDSSPPLVPFPRSISSDQQQFRTRAATPSPRSSGMEALAPRPTVRGRFKSEVESSGSRKVRPSSYDELGVRPGARSRFESMVNLGAASSSGVTSASDLMMMSRDSMDGSAVRMRLVVREEGKPPTHFQLGNCIGRGQFGSVYRALNLNTGQMVAVKRIRLEGLKEEEVTTLMREVDLVKSLSHPSIVKYEGMARDDDSLNIVLEYVENGSLGQTLKAFGKLNERLVASYVVKILEGLHYLHTSDVVHCDLKAANILTTKNGNVKLSDFGVSLNLRAMEREIKDVAGTPNWMAPEVIELKGASTKSDIWSLGCTVVELLTGKPPYAEIANSMSVMFRIVEDNNPPIPEGCSELLKDFLEQCFYKDPTKRPSAELLCEHPWLKMNWVALKGLRTQDSIPWLRRVSTDLQKSNLLSQLEIPDSPVSSSPGKRDDVGRIAPIGRRTSNSSVRPLDNDISPREHPFVKTTFSKPMICRVCLLNVKKTAVLCSQCNLISHAKCAPNAPPTCDLRAQLLLYAQYAEKGNPTSAYSNPADILNEISQNVALSDIPFVDSNTPRNSIDTPITPQQQDPPPTAFKFMAAFKRSRTNLSPEPVTPAPSSSSVLSKDSRDATPSPLPPLPSAPVPIIRRRPSVLQKQRHERPLSMTSISTGLSSLRSVATAAESFSSRQNTALRSQFSNGSTASRRPVSATAAIEKSKDGEHDVPGAFSDGKRRRKNSTAAKPGGCVIQ